MNEKLETAEKGASLSPELAQILSESPESYFEEETERQADLLERRILREQEAERRRFCRDFAETLLLCLAAVAVTLALLRFVVQPIEVIGPSMMETLQNEDVVLLDKFSIRFGELERFDIVVFQPDQEKLLASGIHTDEEDVSFVKRIIGLPGEVVYIDEEGAIHIADSYEGGVFENDRVLEESYGREEIAHPERIAYGSRENPAVLGKDEYFVMGDNRNNSTDSRKEYIGPIRRSQIEGKVFFRILPFDGFGILK